MIAVVLILGLLAALTLLARAADRWLRRNIANKEF